MASDSEIFMIGASTERLRQTYSDELPEFRASSSLIGFKTCIKDVDCVVIYTIEENVATKAICLIPFPKLSFIESLGIFFKLLSCALNNGIVTDFSVRLNGSREQDTKDGLIRPPNYIYVSGTWKKGFAFSATLEGNETKDILKSRVTKLSVSIRRYVPPPSAPE